MVKFKCTKCCRQVEAESEPYYFGCGKDLNDTHEYVILTEDNYYMSFWSQFRVNIEEIIRMN
jgi:hypothetical protein